MKLSRLTLCERMARNHHGRDFVVGDLHGHRALLERALADAGFDTARDRLFSVGDLIDRGPASMETLALLDEPWFHAVMGNHELMLLNFLGFYDSRLHSRRAFAAGGGEWVLRAQSRQRAALWRLAERVAALPLARHVDAAVPFNVMHGDFAPFEYTQAQLFRRPEVCVHQADRATSSRDNVAGALRKPAVTLRLLDRPVQLSERPLGTLPLTYVGHSRMRDVTVHQSHVYLDQGVGARDDARRLPTVLQHGPFGLWLHGVASARQEAPPPVAWAA